MVYRLSHKKSRAIGLRCLLSFILLLPQYGLGSAAYGYITVTSANTVLEVEAAQEGPGGATEYVKLTESFAGLGSDSVTLDNFITTVDEHGMPVQVILGTATQNATTALTNGSLSIHTSAEFSPGPPNNIAYSLASRVTSFVIYNTEQPLYYFAETVLHSSSEGSEDYLLGNYSVYNKSANIDRARQPLGGSFFDVPTSVRLHDSGIAQGGAMSLSWRLGGVLTPIANVLRTTEAAIDIRFAPYQQFNGPNGGDLFDPSFWPEGLVPGPDDVAILDPTSGGNYVIDQDWTVDSLVIGDTLGTGTTAPIGVTLVEGVLLGGLIVVLAIPLATMNVEEDAVITDPDQSGTAALLMNPGSRLNNRGHVDTIRYGVDPSGRAGGGIQTFIRMDGGTADIVEPTSNNTAGSGIIAPDGAISFAALSVPPPKQVVIAPGSDARPISFMTITQELHASPETVLQFDIGETDHDRIDVGTLATIEGAVEIVAMDDLTPDVGDLFDLVIAPEVVLSAGLELWLPATMEGVLEVVNRPDSMQAARFTISELFQLPDGDYNSDGVVDAADYTVWRDNAGAPAGALANDPTGQAVGAAQYGVWQANYGATRSPILTLAPAPEPAGAALLGLLLLFGCARRRRAG
ncbi:MAG: hypothetical protein KDA37_11640 [Planctomycetales bacterium]|nr:hypothetical protein [Planctomycetales bacterium]